MRVEEKRKIVEDIRSLHDKFMQVATRVSGYTSDIEEKLDELEVKLFSDADIWFTVCSLCEEDELAEDAHYIPETNKPLCLGCWDERLRG